ncbi:chromosomal replication initiation protein DnaA, partial [Methylobacterium frigidaeris]
MRVDGSLAEGVGSGRGGNGDDGRSNGEVAAAWQRVKRRLRAELGEDVFASWFARLELQEVSGGVARLTVPTRFLKSWIESHYLDRVLATFRSEADGIESLEVGVRGAMAPARPGAAALTKPVPGPRPAASPASPAAELPEPERAARGNAPEGELGGAPLDARLTFESFVVGRSNALAHAAAERVARHDGGPALYNPLYFHAGVGLGKTHLL